MMRALSSVAALSLVLFAGSFALAENPNDTPDLCVDSLECGGFCGSVQQVNAWMRQCQSGPTGPCFDDCWSTCTAGWQGQNPNPTVCTLECAIADCPASEGNNGLVQAGLVEECPVPAPYAICPMIYAPVDCGGCEYGNTCLAEAAGLNSAACTDVGGPVILLEE